MLTDTERRERDPAAIQRELLAIDQDIIDLGGKAKEYHDNWQKAKIEAAKARSHEIGQRALYDMVKQELESTKERRTGLQSVLRSLI